jgi:hypothetical protein
MARIVSIIQFTGRAGSAVGSKGKNGKILLRQYQPSVANPQTEAQMAQRARFKLSNQVASMLGHVGRVALVANGFRKTERGQLSKMLQKSIVAGANSRTATLPYALHLVNSPKYGENMSVAIASGDNAYTATFTGATEGEVIAKAILVHDTTRGSWRHTSSMDTSDSISIQKAADETGNIEVFAYGIVLMPKTELAASNVTNTGANETGYIINVNAINSSNYDFSPTLSASLNVAGNQNENENENQNENENSQNTQTETVAAPTISGNTSFTDSTEVTITGPAESEIHYTTDGSTPTAESSLYSEALTLSETTTVKAIAIKNGVSSTVSSKTFTKGSGGGSGLGDTN